MPRFHSVCCAIQCSCADCAFLVNALCCAQAYTSQIIAITMIALHLSEDSICVRDKRDAIIDELGKYGMGENGEAEAPEPACVFGNTCVLHHHLCSQPAST